MDLLKAISRKLCKIGDKLVLITNRKSIFVPKSVTLNGVMALRRILRYFTEFGLINNYEAFLGFKIYF